MSASHVTFKTWANLKHRIQNLQTRNWEPLFIHNHNNNRNSSLSNKKSMEIVVFLSLPSAVTRNKKNVSSWSMPVDEKVDALP